MDSSEIVSFEQAKSLAHIREFDTIRCNARYNSKTKDLHILPEDVNCNNSMTKQWRGDHWEFDYYTAPTKDQAVDFLMNLVMRSQKIKNNNMNKKIVFEALNGKLYPIDDVYVANFNPDFSVYVSGEAIHTKHVAFGIYQKSTGKLIDSFEGFGYGTKEDADHMIYKRTIALIDDSYDNGIKDNVDYQSLENIPMVFFGDESMNIILTPLEQYRLSLFKENHDNCGKNKNHGAIGVGYKLIFVYNAIGRSVSVECPFCGHNADITDYSAW